MDSVSRRLLRGSVAPMRYLTVVRPADAPPFVARVYRQMEREFGMLAPPIALHAAAAEPLAAAWLLVRETLLVPGHADRAAKEAVAAGVSLANSCPYCVAVHSGALSGFARARDASAIAEGRFERVGDGRLGQVAGWARETAVRDAASRARRPFPVSHGPEMIGVAVAFHYLNRMVNVFLGESPLPPLIPRAASAVARRALGLVMRRTARRPAQAGAAPGLLPAAPVRADLAWAAGHPVIADTFARVSAAIDRAGERAAPPAVRSLVIDRLSAWDGRPPGVSRAWAEEAVAELPRADRAMGRLALLTAMASYQVSESAVLPFRRVCPDDEALVGLTSWAAFAAARHIGSWLEVGPSMPVDRARPIPTPPLPSERP